MHFGCAGKGLPRPPRRDCATRTAISPGLLARGSLGEGPVTGEVTVSHFWANTYRHRTEPEFRQLQQPPITSMGVRGASLFLDGYHDNLCARLAPPQVCFSSGDGVAATCASTGLCSRFELVLRAVSDASRNRFLVACRLQEQCMPRLASIQGLRLAAPQVERTAQRHQGQNVFPSRLGQIRMSNSRTRAGHGLSPELRDSTAPLVMCTVHSTAGPGAANIVPICPTKGGHRWALVGPSLDTAGPH